MHLLDIYYRAGRYLSWLFAQGRIRRVRAALGHVGNNVSFDSTCDFLTPELVRLGDDVFIGGHAHLSGEIQIGNRVMFGPRATMIGGNHYFAVKGKSVRFLHPKHQENYAPILIQDEVWCGASVVILGGVTLGMGCVIGAGSVVPKSIPPYVVAVGNPCKPIRLIFSDDDLVDHLLKLGKDLSFAQAVLACRQAAISHPLPIVDRTKTYWEYQEEA